ncbi:MAG TPA: hypothetical protein VJ835_01055 [Fimbriimonadaceae bacterium]|nr:hypothetical protein [Fimbriimonadaceae bacterium]
MNARRENQIAWMLVLGVALVLIGILLSILAFGSATSLKSKTPVFFIALGPIAILGGIALAGFGVFAGHLFNRRTNTSGVRTIANCYVVGRYGVNEIGEMVFSDFEELDHPKSKFFVRLKSSNGQDEEFECSRELVGQIGEGMVGNAMVKGRWLGSFVPVPRPS